MEITRAYCTAIVPPTAAYSRDISSWEAYRQIHNENKGICLHFLNIRNDSWSGHIALQKL